MRYEAFVAHIRVAYISSFFPPGFGAKTKVSCRRVGGEDRKFTGTFLLPFKPIAYLRALHISSSCFRHHLSFLIASTFLKSRSLNGLVTSLTTIVETLSCVCILVKKKKTAVVTAILKRTSLFLPRTNAVYFKFFLFLFAAYDFKP